MADLDGKNNIINSKTKGTANATHTYGLWSLRLSRHPRVQQRLFALFYFLLL